MSAGNGTAISVQELRKSYGSVEAVRGIDFEVRTELIRRARIFEQEQPVKRRMSRLVILVPDELIIAADRATGNITELWSN